MKKLNTFTHSRKFFKGLKNKAAPVRQKSQRDVVSNFGDSAETVDDKLDKEIRFVATIKQKFEKL